MSFVQQRYGKANIRMLRVQRCAERHAVRETRIKVTLDGAFARAYTEGDNASVVATDTMKNIVYALAAEHLETANEPFALAAAQCFLERYAHVTSARIELEETPWQRMQIGGQPHAHSFVQAAEGIPFADVRLTRAEQDIAAQVFIPPTWHPVTSNVRLTGTAQDIASGFRDLAIMKTTASGFAGFHRDEYATLPETDDRLLVTRLQARWHFARLPADCADIAETVRAELLRVFAGTYSQSVQDSLYRMGEAALAAAPDITDITLSMPNIHYLPVDLSPFGEDAQDRLFQPTTEPHGHIEATLQRA